MEQIINLALYKHKEANNVMKSYIGIDEKQRRWTCTCGQFLALNIYFMGMHVREFHFPTMNLSILSPEYKIIICIIASKIVQSCSSITTDESGYIIPRKIIQNEKHMGPATKSDSIEEKEHKENGSDKDNIKVQKQNASQQDCRSSTIDVSEKKKWKLQKVLTKKI